jgi:NAD dependent epimerase/dehydratase family enzyme
MKIATTGATNILGRYIVRQLAGAGHRLEAIIRRCCSLNWAFSRRPQNLTGFANST